MILSIYGSSGFIGSNFIKMYPENIEIERNHRIPLSKDILYLISTIDNYNVFSDTTLDVNTNLSILCEVLNHCKKEDMTFNFISSWFVYGKLEKLPAKEDSSCDPQGFYSITKKCAEDLIISFCKTFNLKYRIIRLANVVGEGDKKISAKKNAITWMINKLKQDLSIELYDNGDPLRDFIHVKDACRAIELICKKGNYNEIYNVGSGHPVSIGSSIKLAKNLINSKSKISYISPPKFHSQVQNKFFWMDISKLQSLGFKSEITHEEIIHELCN